MMVLWRCDGCKTVITLAHDDPGSCPRCGQQMQQRGAAELAAGLAELADKAHQADLRRRKNLVKAVGGMMKRLGELMPIVQELVPVVCDKFDSPGDAMLGLAMLMRLVALSKKCPSSLELVELMDAAEEAGWLRVGLRLDDGQPDQITVDTYDVDLVGRPKK